MLNRLSLIATVGGILLIALILGLIYVVSLIIKKSNSKNELSEQQQTALLFAAVLRMWNGMDFSSLQGVKEMTPQLRKGIEIALDRDWGIRDRDTALGVLDWLKKEGARGSEESILSTSLTKEQYLSLKQDPDVRLVPALSDEMINQDNSKWAEQFEDVFVNDPTNFISRDFDKINYNVFITMDSLFNKYRNSLIKPGDTDEVFRRKYLFIRKVTKFLEENYNYTKEEISEITSMGQWDYQRIIVVSGWAYTLGHITQQEAWEYIQWAANQSIDSYSSWRQVTAGYLFGRMIWSGGVGKNPPELKEVFDILLTNKNSIYNKVDYPKEHINL